MERARAPSADRRPRRLGSADPRRRPGRARDGERGVILLDIVLTLAILLMSFRIVWPLLPFTTSPARQTAWAQEIAGLIETDRVAAARAGSTVTTRIDVRRKQFLGGARGWSVTLPKDLALDIVTTTDCTVDADRFALGFAPDGRSCGLSAVLTQTQSKRAVRITVNWLTGLVEVTGGGRGRG